jgi:hypothetical protein
MGAHVFFLAWRIHGLGFDGDFQMNRRTFLSLPLLGFCSTVTEPVYGGMDLAGRDVGISLSHAKAVFDNSDAEFWDRWFAIRHHESPWPGCEVIEGRDGE